MTEPITFSQLIKKSNTDEWFTTEKDVEIIIPYLFRGGYKKILCPFDKKNSSFVKVLNDFGFEVTYGHIETGQDFFDIQDFSEFDAVVSNPPFSKRQAILEKLFSVNIPFALILNFNGLFDSKRRWELFKDNSFELLVPLGRMRFSDGEKVLNSPNFQSVYVCKDMLPKQITFRRGDEE